MVGTRKLCGRNTPAGSRGNIRTDDPLRRVLHMLTGWRPVARSTASLTSSTRVGDLSMAARWSAVNRALRAYIFECYVFFLSFVIFPVIVDSLWQVFAQRCC
jgi:hypothetical protein